jgi:hypothetical protein
MSAGAVRTIVRREVNDTLTDWRILVPIFILTFVLPQLLIAASSVAIDFVGDRGSVVRLIPFAMLLVGFIPASFSLITALESSLASVNATVSKRCCRCRSRQCALSGKTDLIAHSAVDVVAPGDGDLRHFAPHP